MLKQLKLKIFGAADKEAIKEYLLCTIFTITMFSALIIGLNIIGIKPGKLRAFICDSPKACNSASVQVQHVKRMYMPEGVANYSVHTQWEDNIVVISAIKKEM